MAKRPLKTHTIYYIYGPPHPPQTPAASSKSPYRKRPGVKPSDQRGPLGAGALVDRSLRFFTNDPYGYLGKPASTSLCHLPILANLLEVVVADADAVPDAVVVVGRVVVAADERALLSVRMTCRPIEAQSGDTTDHDRAKLRSGWMSPSSAALIACRYVVRASPSLTRLAEPHVNGRRPSFIAIMSAIKRACLPLPLGKG
jgi:hypothetical protein